MIPDLREVLKPFSSAPFSWFVALLQLPPPPSLPPPLTPLLLCYLLLLVADVASDSFLLAWGLWPRRFPLPPARAGASGVQGG